MKWLIGSLAVLLLVLQYRLWIGDGSIQQYMALRKEARETHTNLLQLRSRNQALEAEVADLKSGLDAIEERARTELGMIDENETFYQFVKQRGVEAGAGASADAASVADSSNHASDSDEQNALPSFQPDADGSAEGPPLDSDGNAIATPADITAESN